MSETDCSRCIFCDMCEEVEYCEHFSPIEDDQYIDELIEERRVEFNEYWDEYVQETVDPFYFGE